ncbi:EIN6 ENHANCER-like protein [Drosera capensis]
METKRIRTGDLNNCNSLCLLLSLLSFFGGRKKSQTEIATAASASEQRSKMEREVIEGELVLPSHFSFQEEAVPRQVPKGAIQGEAQETQADDPPNPTRFRRQSPFSSSTSTTQLTKLRHANAEVFKLIRSLPDEYVQRYLALLHAEVIMRRITFQH